MGPTCNSGTWAAVPPEGMLTPALTEYAVKDRVFCEKCPILSQLSFPCICFARVALALNLFTLSSWKLSNKNDQVYPTGILPAVVEKKKKVLNVASFTT